MTASSPLSAQRTRPLIVNHNCTDITTIPEAGINQARAELHIAYGHTSHGSQITDGMTGLVVFANGGGLGLDLPLDIFAWENSGADGALHLHDYAMVGDAGYYPQWVEETEHYISIHPATNVIIWSWCGQAAEKYAAGTLESEYLAPMSQLEIDYPDVMFVYMTGHVDHFADADIKAANNMIRTYCFNNNKILYDFADIESYDPDCTFFAFPHDNCDYYSSSGQLLGNWAREWQSSHIENEEWYLCNSAHSEPLNANRKAYAAWYLWVSLSGYATAADAAEDEETPAAIALGQNFPNPFNPSTCIEYSLSVPMRISLGIYDVRGQLITKLVDSHSAPGFYTLWWDGTNMNGRRVSSGVYLYRLQSGRFVQTRKMILLE